MPRTAAIRVDITITLPYDRKKFGAPSAAEQHALGIKKAVEQVLAGATMEWDALHTTVAIPETPVAPEPVDDVGPMPGFMVRT